jgi:predicted Zn-dependent protease with MMP-like domain
MADGQTLPPSLDDLAAIAQGALSRLPEPFPAWLAGVVFRVEEFPDAAVLKDLELESEFDLLGLYQGLPIGEKTSTQSGTIPDMIFLYRRPLLDYWIETGETLEDVIVHVIIHEVGHHFGLSDADMERLEASAD